MPPSKTRPFDQILSSRTGERHSVGKFAEKGDHRWERARVKEVTEFVYNTNQNRPFYIKADVETTDGAKELMLLGFDLHHLASYVPAETVDQLDGCVVPVSHSMGSTDCYLSAENDYLVTERSDFSVPPEKIETPEED